MDTEQIIFLIIALVLTIFSMYRKSKKQKQSSQKEEPVYYDFPDDDLCKTVEPVVIFGQNEVVNVQQNVDIYTKKNKKTLKMPKIEPVNFQNKNPKNILQNVDLENEIVILRDFEGTEIQKAFLYSEIFKNTKN